MSNDSNEFIGDESSIEKMVKALLEEIRRKEMKLLESKSEVERLELRASILKLRKEVRTMDKSVAVELKSNDVGLLGA